MRVHPIQFQQPLPEQPREAPSLILRIKKAVIPILISLSTFVFLPLEAALAFASLASLLGLIYILAPCCSKNREAPIEEPFIPPDVPMLRNLVRRFPPANNPIPAAAINLPPQPRTAHRSTLQPRMLFPPLPAKAPIIHQQPPLVPNQYGRLMAPPSIPSAIPTTLQTPPPLLQNLQYRMQPKNLPFNLPPPPKWK